MNNKELVAAVAAKHNLTKTAATALLAATAEVMLQNLEQGQDLLINNLGTLEIRQKNERVSVNPKTGERTLIPAKQAIAFKPSPTLKQIVKNK